MTDKIRAFLNKDILLGYYQGDKDVAGLFDPSMLARNRYSISPIAIQQLLLGIDESKADAIDLNDLSNHIYTIPYNDMLSEANRSDELAFSVEDGPVLHVNDYLNIFAARRDRCDFFVTDESTLLGLERVGTMSFVALMDFLRLEPVT